MGLSHQDIAHRWAVKRNVPEDGLRGHALVAYPQTIYSYGMHFPIAQFNDDGTVFFTTDSYSTSTAKHKTYVWRALYDAFNSEYPAFKSVFFLPRNAWSDPRAAVAFYREHILDAMTKWRRARVYKLLHISKGYASLCEFQRYCKREKISFNKLLRKDPQLVVAVSVIALNPRG